MSIIYIPQISSRAIEVSDEIPEDAIQEWGGDSLGRKSRNYGRKFSAEHRKKLSEAHKGIRHTEATKKKMSISMRGIPKNRTQPYSPLSTEHKKKLSELAKGRLHLSETKKKMSETRLGKKRGPYKKRLDKS